MSVVIENSNIIKQYIHDQIKSDNNGLLLSILKQMKAIVDQLNVENIIRSKRQQFWNKTFNFQIGNEKINFSELQKSDLKVKTSLNALQSLIDILGAYLTNRPLTTLSAYYRISETKVYHVQANPTQFYQIRQASNRALSISIEGLKSLVQKGIIETEEERRLLYFINAEANNKEYNKGHMAEAFDKKREQKIIRKSDRAEALLHSVGRTAWNKMGDNADRQVKYLSYSVPGRSNMRDTGSLRSIEEITTYFTQKLYPLIINQQFDNIEEQVDAIYSAFVETENLQFYGKGFEQEAAEELLKVIQQDLNNANITLSL